MKDMKETDWKKLMMQIQEIQIQDLPDEERLHKIYRLSDSFYASMRQLSKRMRRREMYAKACSCAAAAAAVLAVLFSVTHTHEIVEAGRRVMVWMEDFAEFKFQENSDVTAVPEFKLNYVPEGYELVMEEKYEVTGLYLYSNGTDEWMLWYGPSDSEIGLNNEGVDYFILKSDDGRDIYYFEATDGTSEHSLLWISKDGMIAYTITGMLPKEEMMKIHTGINE